jgi:hypothetical protein
MISMALGLIIAATAFSAFRIASKTFSTARNLSRENILLCEGYFAGMDEADFWYGFDDPQNPSGQEERQAYHQNGSPAVVGEDGGYGSPFVPMDLPDEYWNWRVMDPKTWCRMGFLKSTSYGSNAQLGSVNHPDPTAAWLPSCEDALYHHLGLAGYTEYLSPHLPWGWHLGADRRNTFGTSMVASNSSRPSISRMFFDSVLPGESHSRGLQSANKNTGRGAMMSQVGHTMLAPRSGWTFASGAPSAANLTSQRGIRSYAGSHATAGTEIKALADRLLTTPPSTRVSSEGWPALSVGVLRDANNTYNWSTRVVVRVSNPVTGSQRQFVFTPLCTTLRGARQQRQWAHWGGSAMDQ